MSIWAALKRYLSFPTANLRIIWPRRYKFGIVLFCCSLGLCGLILKKCLEPTNPDTQPPVVTLLQPSELDTVYDACALTAQVTDNIGIFQVIFYVDNNPYVGVLFQQNVYRYYWNTTAEADFSAHQIYVKAFDQSSNVASTAPITCIVNNNGRAPLAVTLNPVTNIYKHRLDLSWTRSLDREFLTYQLYRNTHNIWDSSAVLVTEIGDQGTTGFTDRGYNADGSRVTPFGLDENTTYYYRLAVVDTAQRKAYSNVVWATTGLPAAPVLKKEYTATKDRITVRWSCSDTDIRYFRVHRAQSAAVGETREDSIAVVYPPETSYDDTGLVPVTKYYYRVFSVDSAGYWGTSNVIAATTTDLSALQLYYPRTSDIGKNWLRISWSRSKESGDVKYCLYRAEHPLVTDQDQLVVTMNNPDDTVYLDQGLKPLTRYYYVVYQRDGRGNVKPSNEICATTLGLSALPLAIANLGKNTVTLRWPPYTETDFAAYKIYRGDHPAFDTSSAGLKYRITNRSTVTFTDNNLTGETLYYYQLILRDNTGNEAGSQLSLRTRSIEVVEIKNIQNVSSQQKQITFTRNRLDTDFDRYEIYRDTTVNVDRNDELVGTVAVRTDTVFKDNYQFQTGKSYFYRVYVYDKQGNISAGSNILNTGDKTKPGASSLSLSQVDYYFVTLKWLANSEADFHKYVLYRSTDNFKRDSLLVVSLYDRNATSFTDGNLTAGKNYYYQLRTYDVGGNYSKSEILSTITVP